MGKGIKIVVKDYEVIAHRSIYTCPKCKVVFDTQLTENVLRIRCLRSSTVALKVLYGLLSSLLPVESHIIKRSKLRQ